MNDGTIPQYPWSEGDTVFASALNAAIANAGGGETVSVMGFGAKCDGITDDTVAFNAAFASGAKLITIPPNVTCWLPNGITVPGGVHLRGTTFQANGMIEGTAPSSTILTGPNVNCVVLMDDSRGAIHGSTLSDLVITTNNASRPTTGAGVYVHAGYNVRIEHVLVWNAFDGFYFLATPTAGGISGFIENCGSGRIAGHHVVQDSWPELRIISCRFGSNGAGEWVALAYCYVTGGNPNDAIVPNGLFCTNCQFNEAGGGPAFAVGALLLIGGLTNNAAAQEFHFVNCHAEATATFVKTDATVTALNYLQVTGSHFVYQLADFFALNAATSIINNMVLSGNFLNSVTFAVSNALFNDCVISGNSFDGAITLGSTNNSSLAFTGNAVLGNMTISGHWQSLWIGGGSMRGTLTNTATGTVRVDNPGSAALFGAVTAATVNATTVHATTVQATTQFAVTGLLLGGSPTDLTQGALALYSNSYGLNVTPATINVVAGGINVGAFTSAGLTCSNVALPMQGGITAAGTTQGTATALTAPYSNIATVAAGTGVRLPGTSTGMLIGTRYVIWNHGANALNIYPAAGENFWGVAGNAPIVVAAGAKAALVYWGTLWLQED